MIYFDFNKTTGYFTISTEVGVDSAKVNCCLLPFLKNNKEMVLQLETQYQNCYYGRRVRLNNKSKSVYPWIKDFNTLSDYLNELSTDKIAISQLPKEECIDKLKKLGVERDKSNNERLVKINKWKWKTWHWLEYLRIIEDIDIKAFCGGEEAIDRLNNALSESINHHCEGIRMLNTFLAESQK